MADTVADVLLARLREWDIKQVFGYPGDGINGLLAAWGRAKNEPQFVQARHEEMAAFEAAGYAKFSGNVGVCVATSVPGVIHLLNGLVGVNIDTPDAIGPTWDQALTATTPTVLHIRCDPDVPPIPPHATFAQAKATASAILHGDEDAWGFVKEGIKTKAQHHLPGHKDEH